MDWQRWSAWKWDEEVAHDSDELDAVCVIANLCEKDVRYTDSGRQNARIFL